MQTRTTLGQRIKTLRLSRDLTLKQVSARCGLSPTHLSEVERGKTSPTVGALARIAAALGEDASRLIESGVRDAVVVTRAARRRFETAGATLEPLGSGAAGGELSAVSVTLAPGAELPTLADGEQFVLVIEGELDATIGDRTRSLGKGDALHGVAGDWGVVRNPGAAASRLLWLVSPAITL